jgi:hypothetical protein
MDRRARPTLVAVAIIAIIAVVAGACGSSDEAAPSPTDDPSTTATTATTPAPATDLVLDPEHDYGDEYADGILPVGDGRYSTEGPDTGSLYLCRAPGSGGGAEVRGSWFVDDGTAYDADAKLSVRGEVSWEADYATEIVDGQRVITTNDLPLDHTTGEFPVAADDPAYEYDRNPNNIQAQSLTYSVPASPALLDSPQCIGGEVGVMTTGVSLFNAFDAGGRDAGAWEVQDGCGGHPQISGQYHYHTLSSCIADVSVRTVIGWAFDGFPITGPKVGAGSILATSDLDECHGITSTVTIDGEDVTTYHYVMTQDFPYSVSCFRAAADTTGAAG